MTEQVKNEERNEVRNKIIEIKAKIKKAHKSVDETDAETTKIEKSNTIRWIILTIATSVGVFVGVELPGWWSLMGGLSLAVGMAGLRMNGVLAGQCIGYRHATDMLRRQLNMELKELSLIELELDEQEANK